MNVKGTWLACKQFGPLLVAGGGGAIVNIASDTALWGATLAASLRRDEGRGDRDDAFAGTLNSARSASP